MGRASLAAEVGEVDIPGRAADRLASSGTKLGLTPVLLENEVLRACLNALWNSADSSVVGGDRDSSANALSEAESDDEAIDGLVGLVTELMLSRRIGMGTAVGARSVESDRDRLRPIAWA